MASNIVLSVGFMGCGKSAVGKRLAAMLGWGIHRYGHADREKSERYESRGIFCGWGETAFREMERSWSLSFRGGSISDCHRGSIIKIPPLPTL